MGDCFVKWYREKVKSTWKLAFFSAFIMGLLIHIFKFNNITPVQDSLYNLYNSQNMVQSGRWFLTVACGFSSLFDLPWINGLFSVFFISLTAAVIAEVFEMKNPCLIVISSGMLVSFPAIYATFGFGFTADGYMIAMLLAALSVQLTKIPEGEYVKKNLILRTALGAACICLSCGIYQAYISFAYLLAIFYIIGELLRNAHSTKKYVTWILGQIVMYVVALAAYYVIWKACMYIQGYAATTYQGLDSIGQFGGRSLSRTIYELLYSFVMFFLEYSPVRYGFTKWSVLSILVLVAFVVGLILACFRSGCIKNKFNTIIIALCVLSIPFGCCVLMFTSEEVFYHTLMMQSICTLYIFTGVLWENWFKPKFSTVVGLLLFVVVLNNAVMANIYYKHLDDCFKRTQALAVEVNTRVHMLDDGNIKYICFAGKLDDYTNEERMSAGILRETGPWKWVAYTLLSERFIAAYTDFDLAYYRDNGLEYPVVNYTSGELPFPKDYELRFPLLSEEQRALLMDSQEFKDMPQWPAKDSVKVIGETVVIKLSNP